MPTAWPRKQRIGGLQSLLSSSLCLSQRSSSAASAAREALFQPKDLVWLDPCDEHRDEGIKQAAPGIPNLNRP
ncbi:hypothetical protein CN080_10400 [Sinorhizobium meliloti]|nr:hypothetical protein CN080_10000 [Sinorhizobium meliloti]RVP24664.1 hypothetical protein CN080_10400 [Sinorhizobium meliloti]